MSYSKLKACLQDTDKDTLKNLIDRFGVDLVIKYQENGCSLDSMEEAYQGEHRDDEEFVQELLESCGDIPKLPNYVYIDWERTAKDIMMDYFEINGHYFRSL